MGVSVVMTTYNGEEFIKYQLDSILNQSMKPDEVLIYDDVSKDKTVDIIKDYILKHKLENWKIFINNTNLGYSLNFIKAVKSAKYDLIFLSDQDDVWHINKIRDMVKIMLNNSNISALSSRFNTINAQNKEIYWKNNLLNKRRKTSKLLDLVTYNKLSIIGRIIGCSLLLRKSVIDIIPVKDEKYYAYYSHDTYLLLLSSLIGDVYIVNKEYLYYRIHSKNTSLSQGTEKDKKQTRIQKLHNRINFMNYFLESMNKKIKDKNRRFTLNFQKFEKSRVEFLSSPNIFYSLILIFSLKYYYYYTWNLKNALHILFADLMYLIK